MVLVVVPDLPAYQGRGVGLSSIRWGTRIVDEEGKYVFQYLRRDEVPDE